MTVISEPGSNYLTHLPPGPKSAEIAQAIYNYLSENSLLEAVKIIGADSRAVKQGGRMESLLF